MAYKSGLVSSDIAEAIYIISTPVANAGGGAGGTLAITGAYDTTVTVSIDFKNMARSLILIKPIVPETLLKAETIQTCL